MKKLVWLLLILLSFSGTKLFAQNGGGDRMQQMQQAYKQYLKDSVKLSDALTDSVMAVRMQYQPQMRDIFMDQSASVTDKKAKMESLRTEMEARYKAAGLTDDQVQTIHQHDDMMRQRMMNRMNNNSGGGNQ